VFSLSPSCRLSIPEVSGAGCCHSSPRSDLIPGARGAQHKALVDPCHWQHLLYEFSHGACSSVTPNTFQQLLERLLEEELKPRAVIADERPPEEPKAFFSKSKVRVGTEVLPAPWRGRQRQQLSSPL